MLTETHSEPFWKVYDFTNNGLVTGGFSLENRGNGSCVLWCVKILDNLRNMGFGKKMLEECIEMARSSGFRVMLLKVYANNEIAIKLYKKLGFTIQLGNQKMHTPGQELYHFMIKKL